MRPLLALCCVVGLVACAPYSYNLNGRPVGFTLNVPGTTYNSITISNGVGANVNINANTVTGLVQFTGTWTNSHITMTGTRPVGITFASSMSGCTVVITNAVVGTSGVHFEGTLASTGVAITGGSVAHWIAFRTIDGGGTKAVSITGTSITRSVSNAGWWLRGLWFRNPVSSLTQLLVKDLTTDLRALGNDGQVKLCKFDSSVTNVVLLRVQGGTLYGRASSHTTTFEITGTVTNSRIRIDGNAGLHKASCGTRTPAECQAVVFGVLDNADVEIQDATLRAESAKSGVAVVFNGALNGGTTVTVTNATVVGSTAPGKPAGSTVAMRFTSGNSGAHVRLERARLRTEELSVALLHLPSTAAWSFTMHNSELGYASTQTPQLSQVVSSLQPGGAATAYCNTYNGTRAGPTLIGSLIPGAWDACTDTLSASEPPTPTPSRSTTLSPPPTPTRSHSRSWTRTVSRSAGSPTPSVTAALTVSASATLPQSMSLSRVLSATLSTLQTASVSTTATTSGSATPSAAASATASPVQTVTPTPSVTPLLSATASQPPTPSSSKSATPPATPTATRPPTRTQPPTPTWRPPTRTNSRTMTPSTTPSASVPRSRTTTPPRTGSPTATLSMSPRRTATDTVPATPTHAATPTYQSGASSGASSSSAASSGHAIPSGSTASASSKSNTSAGGASSASPGSTPAGSSSSRHGSSAPGRSSRSSGPHVTVTPPIPIPAEPVVAPAVEGGLTGFGALVGTAAGALSLQAVGAMHVTRVAVVAASIEGCRNVATSPTPHEDTVSWVVDPLRLALGQDEGRYYRGGVASNAALGLVALLLALIAVVGVGLSPLMQEHATMGARMVGAATLLSLPSLLLVPFGALLPGITTAALLGVFYGAEAALDAPLSGVALLGAAAVMAASVLGTLHPGVAAMDYKGRAVARGGITFDDREAALLGGDDDVGPEPWWAAAAKSALGRRGEWRPSALLSASQIPGALRMALFFRPYRGIAARRTVAGDFAATLVFAAVAAIRPSTLEACGVLQWALAALALGLAVYGAALRPFNRAFVTWFFVAGMGLCAGGSAAAAVGFGGKEDGTVEVGLWMVFGGAMVLSLSSLVHLVVSVVERCRGEYEGIAEHTQFALRNMMEHEELLRVKDTGDGEAVLPGATGVTPAPLRMARRHRMANPWDDGRELLEDEDDDAGKAADAKPGTGNGSNDKEKERTDSSSAKPSDGTPVTVTPPRRVIPLLPGAEADPVSVLGGVHLRSNASFVRSGGARPPLPTANPLDSDDSDLDLDLDEVLHTNARRAPPPALPRREPEASLLRGIGSNHAPSARSVATSDPFASSSGDSSDSFLSGPSRRASTSHSSRPHTALSGSKVTSPFDDDDDADL